MRFLIADSFTKGLAGLDQDLQNQVKQSLFDFQTNPQQPSLKFHRIDKAKDKGFWSFRVNDDARVVVHKHEQDFVFCYVDHHDKAYKWAENRRMEVHPTTGAAQLVEVHERVEEVVKRVVREVHKEASLFAKYDPAYLLALGVPQEWLGAVRHVGDTGFLSLSEHLPQEAAENLMLLAEGHPVPTPTPVLNGDPFLHPDARRRFAVVSRNEPLLHQALTYPLDKWVLFLHPTQRALVQRTYNGPARVGGGAGTGKTVVALHRAAHLVSESENASVLLTTYSRALAGRLSHAVDQLLEANPTARSHVRVTHLHRLAKELFEARSGAPFRPLSETDLLGMIKTTMMRTGEASFSAGFLLSEWQHVIDAYGIDAFPAYRQAKRVGRGTPLGVKQRMSVWSVLGKVREHCLNEGMMTYERLCHEAASLLERQQGSVFDHVIADEAQDFGPAELRLLRALAPKQANDLFLVGDDGQRIYKAMASLRSCGVEVVGRSSVLRLNYRTTEQIRRHADALLPTELQDSDGTPQSRVTVSLLRGPDPEFMAFTSVADEIRAVAERISYYLMNGFQPRDIAVFARTMHVLKERAEAALDLCGYKGQILSEETPPGPEFVSLGTMHRAKGLEFKIVILMGCESNVLPLPTALAAAPDETERRLVREQERNLLYVASTRARERLLVTYTGRGSVFLAPLIAKSTPDRASR